MLRGTNAFEREPDAIDHADPLELLPGVDETVVNVLHYFAAAPVGQAQVYNIPMKFAVLRAARAASGRYLRGARAVPINASAARHVRSRHPRTRARRVTRA
jgi:hypothetical protein